jgi:protein-tyrosine phosphatase
VGFVDCHSHVLHGVDDGSATLRISRAMLAAAVGAGTRLLFATPHVGPPEYPWTPRRCELIRARFAELEAPPGLELRLGWEVTPTPALLRADPAPLRLGGLDALLVDGPDTGPAEHDALLEPYVRHVVACGLRPIVAHPERVGAHPEPDRDLAKRLRDAGALLQIDRGGLLGEDGAGVAAEAMRLLEAGWCDLLASDAHVDAGELDLRPVRRAAAATIGAPAAARLLDGQCLLAAAFA